MECDVDLELMIHDRVWFLNDCGEAVSGRVECLVADRTLVIRSDSNGYSYHVSRIRCLGLWTRPAIWYDPLRSAVVYWGKVAIYLFLFLLVANQQFRAMVRAWIPIPVSVPETTMEPEVDSVRERFR